MKIFLVVIGLLQSYSIYAKCKLVDQYQIEEERELSNGHKIPLPARAFSFDTIALYSLLDYKKASELLAKEGLYPLSLYFEGEKKAVGVLSSYDYKKSDMGTFTEAYFVIIATNDKNQKVYRSIFKILKALRGFPGGPPSDTFFYHVNAFSNDRNGRLASEEIWGIDSKYAHIDFNKGTWFDRFFVTHRGLPVVGFRVRKKRMLKNPVGFNFHLLATGENSNGPLVYSPVMSCGKTKFQLYDKEKHQLLLFPSELKKNLEFLKFRPLIVDLGKNLQAVQFAPNL